MTIRDAVSDDVAELAELEAAMFGREAWSAQLLATELAADRDALVALDGDSTVGYAVSGVVGDVADLHRVAVVPTHRRRGVARALLAEVTRRARAAGATRMLLEVADGNVPARACYEALGWVELDRRAAYYRDGGDAVVLRLDLTQESP